MRRMRGTGCLFGLLEYMIVATVVMGLNLIMMFLMALLRNLPAILHAMRQALRESLIWAYRLYRPAITKLQNLARQYLHIDLTKAPFRIIATALFSLLALLGIDLLFRWRVLIFFVVLAILHGTVVGLLWDELEQNDHLHTGERIR